MRRMPDDRRLASLAAQGAPLRPQVGALAQLLAGFHARPRRGAGGRRPPRPCSAVAGQHRPAARARPGRCDPEQLARVQALAERYLAGRGRPCCGTARRPGRCVDGHGDLLADDVFLLDDGPRVLDCLEFDARLRAGDVLADVAFLAMDLERLGRPDLARLLLEEHRRAPATTGRTSLADHWIAYRAQVRAKVACLRAEQGDAPAPLLAAAVCWTSPSGTCAGHGRASSSSGGSPGTGKSTLAAGWASATGWTVLRSDVVRKRADPRSTGTSGLDRGLTGPRCRRRSWPSCWPGGGAARRRPQRGPGRDLGEPRGRAGPRPRPPGRGGRARPAHLPARRPGRRPAAQRAARGDDPSDAGPDVARALRRRVLPWPDAVRLDTRPPAPSVLTTALAVLADDGWTPEP